MSVHNSNDETAGEKSVNDLDIDQIDSRKTAMMHMPSGLRHIGDLFGVGEELLTKLYDAGFETVPDIHHTSKWKLTLIEGIGDDTARGLKALASSRCDYHFGDYAWEPFKQYEPTIARGVSKTH